MLTTKSRDWQKQDRRIRRNNSYYTIGFSIVGGLFLYAAYHFYHAKDHVLQAAKLQTITDVITNKAEISSTAKGRRSIHIRLKSFPEFDFQITGNAYSATYAPDYAATVKTGDSLSLDIRKAEYQMKLTREKEPGFFDKTMHYSLINVYGLRHKNHTYLQLSDYNRVRNRDSLIGVWLFGILGLLMLVAGGLQFSQQWLMNAVRYLKIIPPAAPAETPAHPPATGTDTNQPPQSNPKA